VPPTVTEDRSERGPGSWPATVAVPRPRTACTLARLAATPPPNRYGVPPSSAPAASWLAAASRPARAVRPVTGLSSVTARVVTDRWFSPPMISRFLPVASTTSREIPEGSW
jgi:hypothetical protein